MDKDTTQSTFFEYLRPLNLKKFLHQYLDLDRYVKKCGFQTWLDLMIYAQLNQIPSLKQLDTKLKNNEELQEAIHLSSISDSQLSRKLRDTDAKVLQSLFSRVVNQMNREIQPKHRLQASGPIYLVDASIISLCLSLSRWAKYRPHQGKGGVKIHMCVAYQSEGTTPKDAVLQPAIHSDRSQMNELVLEPGALYIFDRGYLDYKAYDQYCEDGIRFLTRLKENAVVEEIEEYPVPSDSAICRHVRVRLGSIQNEMNHDLRMIETYDSEGNRIRLITNDWTYTGEEISQLYRCRWQIELFFKWVKQHLKIKTFYGQSLNAVYNQIWIALITYCLTSIMKARANKNQPLLKVFLHVRDLLFQPMSQLIQSLHRQPTRKSKGRRRTDPEREYQQFINLVDKEGFENAAAVYTDVHNE